MTPDKTLLRRFLKAESPSPIETELDKALCQRDHTLLEIYYPAVFTAVCQMVAAGVGLDTIENRARRIVGSEPVMLQRVVNAAKFEKGLQVGK